MNSNPFLQLIDAPGMLKELREALEVRREDLRRLKEQATARDEADSRAVELQKEYELLKRTMGPLVVSRFMVKAELFQETYEQLLEEEIEATAGGDSEGSSG